MRRSIKNISSRSFLLILSLGMSLFAATSVQSAAHPDQEIIDRIKPAGVVCVKGEVCGEEDAAAAGDSSAQVSEVVEAAVAAARSGEQIYNASCFACHGAGIAGAPVLGDKDAWASRIANGMDTMMANALNGINAMPARGTCMDCSDEEIQASVQYMVDSSQ